MKNKHIYDIWTDFVNNKKYKKYFESNEDKWNNNFKCVKDYIDENDKRPSSKNKNTEIRMLGKWITKQMENYDKKIKIMTDNKIHKIWDNFINRSEYSIYFESNEDKWLRIFDTVKKYIDDNKKKPSCVDKNKEIKKLGS